MKVHKKDFKYIGAADEDNLSLAFSKKRAEDRKQWLAGNREINISDLKPKRSVDKWKTPKKIKTILSATSEFEKNRYRTSEK